MRVRFGLLHKNRGARNYSTDPRAIGDQRVDYLYHCGICGSTVDERRESSGDGVGYREAIDSNGDYYLEWTGGCNFCKSRSWRGI